MYRYGSHFNDMRGIRDMASYRERNSRGRKAGFLQQVLLLFLIGFFVGAVFYTLFQNSFAGLMGQLEGNMSAWQGKEYNFWYEFLHALWSHGKYFILLWILSVNIRAGRIYQRGFTIYTGIRNGFLLLFFLMGKGGRGCILYLASLFPQCIILVPLYLFSFLWQNESGKKEHRGAVYVGITVFFLMACLLEVKVNLPLMEKVM